MPRLREPPKAKEEPKVEAAPEAAIEEEPIEVEIVEAAPASEPPQSPPNEAMIALQKQLDDLKKSEEIQKQAAVRFQQERDEALQRAREREAQVQRVQKEAYDSQADAIGSALAAAQAEADKAQLDIENAISVGDPKAQAEAHRRLAMATANLSRLEEGKAAIEARANEQPRQEQPGLSKAKQDYIAQHPDIANNDRVREDAGYFHRKALFNGIVEDSPAYFDFLSENLGYKAKEEIQEEVPVQPKSKGNAIVSAPVSRDIPGSSGKRANGKVTLTPAEVDAARTAGITVEEYAKQKLRRDEMIASGEYSTQR